MNDELDHLLKQGTTRIKANADSQSQESNREARREARKRRKEDRQKRRLLALSMGISTTWWHALVSWLLLALPFAVAALSWQLPGQWHRTLWLKVGMVIESEPVYNSQWGSMLVAFVVSAMLAWAFWLATVYLRQKQERRFLSTLPFRFDVPEYERVLSTKHDFVHLDVAIRFRDVLNPEAREILKTALHGAAKIETLQVRDAAVIIGSHQIQTSMDPHAESTDGGSTRPTAHNRPIHEWLSRLIRRGLLVIHRSYPITGVTVQVRSRGFPDSVEESRMALYRYPWW